MSRKNYWKCKWLRERIRKILLKYYQGCNMMYAGIGNSTICCIIIGVKYIFAEKRGLELILRLWK